MRTLYKPFPTLYQIIIFSLAVLPLGVNAQQRSSLASLQNDIRKLVIRFEPSIVSVSATHTIRVVNEEKKSGASQNAQSFTINNIATGVVFDSFHVVTQTNAVSGSRDVSISLPNGKDEKASVIGSNHTYGLSVLKLQDAHFKPIDLTPATDLGPGSLVVIIGNSLGVSPAVSFGVVNCLRSDGLVQIAVNLAAGSAGGAVFDANGEWVGILATGLPGNMLNVVEATSFQTNETFLVYPASEVKSTIAQIIERGPVPHGYLGVLGKDWPGKLQGTHVTAITPQSPADKAGLQIGDIILSMDSIRLVNTMQLAQLIKKHKPNDTVMLKVLRGKEKKNIDVTLGALPDNQHSKPTLYQYRNCLPYFQSSVSASQKDMNINRDFLLKRIKYLQSELEMLKNMVDK